MVKQLSNNYTWFAFVPMSSFEFYIFKLNLQPWYFFIIIFMSAIGLRNLSIYYLTEKKTMVAKKCYKPLKIISYEKPLHLRMQKYFKFFIFFSQQPESGEGYSLELSSNILGVQLLCPADTWLSYLSVCIHISLCVFFLSVICYIYIYINPDLYVHFCVGIYMYIWLSFHQQLSLSLSSFINGHTDRTLT